MTVDETTPQETERADPKNLQPDPEIAYHLVGTDHNRLEVLNAKPEKAYCWVRAYHRDGRWDTTEVYQKQSQTVLTNEGVKVRTWEMVIGTKDGMKNREEAADCERTAEGYRRIGDCVLMRCDRDVYEFIQAEVIRQHRRFAGKGEEHMRDVTQQIGGGAIRFRTFNGNPREAYARGVGRE